MNFGATNKAFRLLVKALLSNIGLNLMQKGVGIREKTMRFFE